VFTLTPAVSPLALPAYKGYWQRSKQLTTTYTPLLNCTDTCIL